MYQGGGKIERGAVSASTENHCPGICPLCGKPNGCGLATASTPCWCSSVTISESILKAIPPEARNVVCICKACATAAG
ncbi:MAG: cysteine-rich CWC family protein [Steroidobacteraceae bacterium]